MNPDDIEELLARRSITYRDLANAIGEEAFHNYDTRVVFVDVSGIPIEIREVCRNSDGVVEVRLKV